MTNVFISGVTGFLGSHIAEKLISLNFKVIGLKRKDSNTWRCEQIMDKILWIDIDDENFRNNITQYSIDVFIHSAWIGVKADDRNNWKVQSQNIKFLDELLQITKVAGVRKIIFLGSQAEYGQINGKVHEEEQCEATNAYGKAKLACLSLLKGFACVNSISWIWLRLFSIYGEKEDETWLIPDLIQKIKTDKMMDLTLGEQKYAYLYVKDFTSIIWKLTVKPVESGIYNVSSTNVVTIKTFVEKIRDIVKPNFQLNFGALEYRENQSMHIEGSIEKITSQIGKIDFTDFDVALNSTIKYYLN